MTRKARKYPSLTEYLKEPLKEDSSGIPRRQACYICKEWIDLLKDKHGLTWIKVGPYRRHRDCSPIGLKGAL